MFIQYKKPASVGVVRYFEILRPPNDASYKYQVSPLPGRHNDHCRLIDHEASHNNQPDSNRLH